LEGNWTLVLYALDLGPVWIKSGNMRFRAYP
jgi:hypothetical protein